MSINFAELENDFAAKNFAEVYAVEPPELIHEIGAEGEVIPTLIVAAYDHPDTGVRVPVGTIQTVPGKQTYMNGYNERGNHAYYETGIDVVKASVGNQVISVSKNPRVTTKPESDSYAARHSKYIKPEQVENNLRLLLRETQREILVHLGIATPLPEEDGKKSRLLGRLKRS